MRTSLALLVSFVCLSTAFLVVVDGRPAWGASENDNAPSPLTAWLRSAHRLRHRLKVRGLGVAGATPGDAGTWAVRARAGVGPSTPSGAVDLSPHTLAPQPASALRPKLNADAASLGAVPPSQIAPRPGATLSEPASPPTAALASHPGLGHHAIEYLKRAAVARSPLLGRGGVAYDFTNLPARPSEVVARSSPSPSSRPRAKEEGTSRPPLRIAQYSHVYGPSPVWSGNFTGCDSPCEAVPASYGNASAAASADVVVVDLMHPHTPWDRPAGQVWVGTYFESPDHYPALRDAATLAQFNYTTGYRPDADFPNFNMVRDTGQHVAGMVAWPLPAHAAKRRHPMLSTWISNCELDSLGRLRLLDELAGHNVSIASYGKCGPGQAAATVGPDLDARWHDWAVAGGPGAEKAAVSGQHLFMYAAENSGCAYYVTEKVFHAFLGGSVPVYVGDTASLKKLAPPGSVIYSSDYKEPAALAAHLHHLASNQTAYAAYLAWRADPAALDPLHALMSLPTWESTPAGSSSRACVLCEFLWAAPRRAPPSDLCQPVESAGAKFRSRL